MGPTWVHQICVSSSGILCASIEHELLWSKSLLSCFPDFWSNEHCLVMNVVHIWLFSSWQISAWKVVSHFSTAKCNGQAKSSWQLGIVCACELVHLFLSIGLIKNFENWNCQILFDSELCTLAQHVLWILDPSRSKKSETANKWICPSMWKMLNQLC